MKKTAMIITVAASIAGGTVSGQTAVFQQAESIKMIGPGSYSFTTGTGSELLQAVAGSPFSGTQTRTSLQVLGDGTRIERNESSQISRDSEGRTRTESNEEPVKIEDPVTGTSYSLDTEQKTAEKSQTPRALFRVKAMVAQMVSENVAQETTSLNVRSSTSNGTVIVTNALPNKKAPAAEDLGVQSVNGVLAKGTRTTISIPVGEIGNDREIKVVNERWYSDELQMVVKSSNSDPRFGTTTVELTGISRLEPSASLFQVPPGYTITEQARTITIKTKE